MHPRFDGNDLIIDVRIQCFRNKSRSDTLNFMRARFSAGKNRRIRRLYRIDFDGWICFFQHFARSRDGSAGTDSGHERIKLVVTKLFYDFFPVV